MRKQLKQIINLSQTRKPSPDKLDDPLLIIFHEFPLLKRRFQRFDFEDEWNNLGFGRITIDDSKFSISDWSLPKHYFDIEIAYLSDSQGKYICPFAGIKEEIHGAKLYVNREAGLKDCVSIFLLEDFLINYRPEKLGSIPILSEIPHGYKSAVTMRIDCDENISSGQQLFELYKSCNIPFSLAITTKLDFDQKNKKTIYDVIDAGGAVVSHSHTHAPNWGGSREQARWEAETARKRLQEILPLDYNYDYVVSPFHQNPQYAVQGLVDAGIKGFVGGIIKNDPEYLQARAGYVSTGEKIITHSQQCMFHGDCYHNAGNSIEVYKQSFKNHYNTNTFFGYLDHPFSDYTYGWLSEEERLSVHREFIEYMKSFDKVWFANLIDAMNFLYVKSNTKLWEEDGKIKCQVEKHSFDVPDLKVFWNKKELRVDSKDFNVQVLN